MLAGVEKLKDWKSPGVDGISTELIKAGGPTLVTEIGCNIIRHCKKSGQNSGQNWCLLSLERKMI